MGHYIRDGVNDSAEIKVRHLGESFFYVEGLAFWGTKRAHGPNIGTLEFEAEAQGMILRFLDSFRGEEYEAILRFGGEVLILEERGINGNAGMNVTFEGRYEKAA